MCGSNFILLLPLTFQAPVDHLSVVQLRVVFIEAGAHEEFQNFLISSGVSSCAPRTGGQVGNRTRRSCCQAVACAPEKDSSLWWVRGPPFEHAPGVDLSTDVA